MLNKRLRSGFTTGACAAAASKAAALFVLTGETPLQVEIPFPDKSRHVFMVHRSWQDRDAASASVIKDAGDDPDVTNGAEICSSVRYLTCHAAPQDCITVVYPWLFLGAGKGVGVVTRPGLAVAPGEPAINPTPRRMIAAAIHEAMSEAGVNVGEKFMEIRIGVPNGEALAEKTLNRRLGILGGLSILGTTGIVKPVSADAWMATIEASLDVAKASGLEEIIISTGRTSEKAVQRLLSFPEQACVMMGDYLHFTLTSAARRRFLQIHLAGMWAKIVKAALKTPQTHVRHGTLEVRQATALIAAFATDASLLQRIAQSNTAREIMTHLEQADRQDIIRHVCLTAKMYAEEVSGLPVQVYLVNVHGEIAERV